MSKTSVVYPVDSDVGCMHVLRVPRDIADWHQGVTLSCLLGHARTKSKERRSSEQIGRHVFPRYKDRLKRTLRWLFEPHLKMTVKCGEGRKGERTDT